MSGSGRVFGGMASLWLGLVEERCLSLAVTNEAPSMTPAELVKLLDAAMRSGDAPAYLGGVQRTFEDSGRRGDAVISAVLLALLENGEVETVMGMRAEWSSRGTTTQLGSTV